MDGPRGAWAKNIFRKKIWTSFLLILFVKIFRLALGESEKIFAVFESSWIYLYNSNKHLSPKTSTSIKKLSFLCTEPSAGARAFKVGGPNLKVEGPKFFFGY